MKKKKNRQPSTSKAEATEAAQGDDWNETQPHQDDKPKSRGKNSGPPRLHGRHNDSRGCKYIKPSATNNCVIIIYQLFDVTYYTLVFVWETVGTVKACLCRTFSTFNLFY